MNKSIMLGLLVGGIVLTVFGISEMNSFTSYLSRMFTGAPTDRSIWMFVGGLALFALGLAGAVSGSHNS